MCRWPCWPETLRCRPSHVLPNRKNPLGNDRSKPAGTPLSQLPVLPDFHLRWADAVGRWKTVAAVQSLSRVRLSVTPWTAACLAPLSTAFPSQECWSGLPFSQPWGRTHVSCIAGRFFSAEPLGQTGLKLNQALAFVEHLCARDRSM